MTSQKTISTTFRIAIGQLNPAVGDIAGNLAKAREARADAARSGADLLLLTELFISGYPPEDLVLKPAFLRACQKAGRCARGGYSRWRAGGRGRFSASGRGRTAQFRRGSRRWQGAGRSRQDRSAELWRIRRKACFRRRCDAGAGQFPRRAARHPDLRGNLERHGGLRNAGGKRRGNPARAQWLAVLSRQDRRTPPGRASSGDRDRLADDLCQPARRPGRTGLRWRQLRL